MGPRLVEEPLGGLAEERPVPEKWAEVWAKALSVPVPDYPLEALRRLPPCR